MIFNEKYNKSLELMHEVAGEDFQNTYNQIIKLLSKEELEKCKKCKAFKNERSNDDTEVYLRTFKDGDIENEVELTIHLQNDDIDQMIYYVIDASALQPENLKYLGIGEEDDEIYFNLGFMVIDSISKDSFPLFFKFQLRRTNENEYTLNYKKTIGTEKVIKSKVKKYTYQELSEKLKANTNKR